MAEESEKRFEALMSKLFHTPPKSKTNSNNSSGSTIFFVGGSDVFLALSNDFCSTHGVQTLSGRKRPHLSSAGARLAGNVDSGSSLSVSATSTPAPACRPWDRDDLFRRLSTFKSMTWFAKPQVVSPLECARRGWVNVDMDTIACASCDARLLFSTPSAWTQQQGNTNPDSRFFMVYAQSVEKAAMVFSLKLDSGHKSLCPWINNACMEDIAKFPIVSRADLIEDYKNAFSLCHS
ncbi:UNVERIFIED_CONTAM: Nuclear-interacting partner of ALK [Sesamum latifolium]|uniref:Nuclear-interacting partner of ALK n=1 Tax=Sesamum latifolium TaxID=2727402 RepID=A0AAW2UIZ9_9LAMI